MFVRKKTYNELFDLFIKEKHGALAILNERQELQQRVWVLEDLVREMAKILKERE